jgi:hypothetical protein
MQIAAPRTRAIIEKNVPLSTAGANLRFRGRAATPQIARGCGDAPEANFPSETAGNFFEFPCPLAQKQLPPDSRSAKSSLVWRKTAKSFEKIAPSFGAMAQKL